MQISTVNSNYGHKELTKPERQQLKVIQRRVDLLKGELGISQSVPVRVSRCIGGGSPYEANSITGTIHLTRGVLEWAAYREHSLSNSDIQILTSDWQRILQGNLQSIKDKITQLTDDNQNKLRRLLLPNWMAFVSGCSDDPASMRSDLRKLGPEELKAKMAMAHLLNNCPHASNVDRAWIIHELTHIAKDHSNLARQERMIGKDRFIPQAIIMALGVTILLYYLVGMAELSLLTQLGAEPDCPSGFCHPSYTLSYLTTACCSLWFFYRINKVLNDKELVPIWALAHRQDEWEADQAILKFPDLIKDYAHNCKSELIQFELKIIDSFYQGVSIDTQHDLETTAQRTHSEAAHVMPHIPPLERHLFWSQKAAELANKKDF